MADEEKSADIRQYWRAWHKNVENGSWLVQKVLKTDPCGYIDSFAGIIHGAPFPSFKIPTLSDPAFLQRQPETEPDDPRQLAHPEIRKSPNVGPRV